MPCAFPLGASGGGIHIGVGGDPEHTPRPATATATGVGGGGSYGTRRGAVVATHDRRRRTGLQRIDAGVIQLAAEAFDIAHLLLVSVTDLTGFPYGSP